MICLNCFPFYFSNTKHLTEAESKWYIAAKIKADKLHIHCKTICYTHIFICLKKKLYNYIFTLRGEGEILCFVWNPKP